MPDAPRGVNQAAPSPTATPFVSAPPPRLLSETGLYSPGSSTVLDAKILEYSPQYPLWSDGARKRRFIQLPAGAAIDGTRPDEWSFPPGTRFWKEFSFGQRRVETRYIERLADGSYRFAAYVWDSAQRDAVLAPADGAPAVAEIAPGVAHDVPGVTDCGSCHEGRRVPILGFNALQLSADRDPLAAHAETPPPGAVDLPELVRRGLLVHVPAELVAEQPRIAARSKIERAAAGYLFGNCAHCHNATGPLSSLGLDFDESIEQPGKGIDRFEASVVARSSRFLLPGETASVRVSPGQPSESVVLFRMRSRFPAAQMPPLGTKLVDAEGTRLVEQWITASHRSPAKKEVSP